MRDVEWITRKGRINIKALTDRAREYMLNDMGMISGSPVFKDAGVFMMAVQPHDLEALLAKMRAHGLQTDDNQAEREEQLRKLTEF